MACSHTYVTLSISISRSLNGAEQIRHPNYLGEMMLYSAYALLAWRAYPWTVLLSVWTVLFATNMVHKEVSMSRYYDWEEYRRRTWWLLPGIF